MNNSVSYRIKYIIQCSRMIKNYIHSIIKLNHRSGIQPEYLPRFPTFKKGDYFWLMMLTIFSEFFLCYFLYLFYITLTSYQQLFLGSIVMMSHHCEIGAKYLQKFVEVLGLHLGPLPTGGMGVVFVDGFYFGKVIQPWRWFRWWVCEVSWSR